MSRTNRILAFIFLILTTASNTSSAQVIAPNVGSDDENTLILSLPAGAAATLQNAPSAPTATTTIGLSIVIPRRFYLGATFNIGATSSIIVESTQAALLLLDPSGMGNSFDICGYYYPLRGRLWQRLLWGLGLALDAGAGTGKLAGEVDGVPISCDINSVYGLIGVQGQFGPITLEALSTKNFLTAGINIAGGVRSFAGDGALPFADALRQGIIGTCDTLFAELLVAAFLQINGTQVFARITYIPTSQPVRGISGLQMSISFKLETALIQGVVKTAQ